MQNQTGGCMCGAVRYELLRDDPWIVYCHCDACRKHTGAPVTVLVTVTPDDVRWTAGQRARYESSPERFRGYCRDCGASLTWEASSNGSWMAIHISSFDQPELLPPTEHVFLKDALPWHNHDDGLTKYHSSKHILNS